MYKLYNCNLTNSLNKNLDRILGSVDTFKIFKKVEVVVLKF